MSERRGVARSPISARKLERVFIKQGHRLGLSDEMLNAVMLSASKKSREDQGEAGSVGSSLSPGSAESDQLSVSIHSSLFDDAFYTDAAQVVPKAGEIGAASNAAASHLLEQMEALRHEKKLLELDYERAQGLARREISQSAQRHKNEVKALKEELARTKKNLPELEKRLEVRRSDFADLGCSPAHYEDLRARREDDLTLRELVLVKVFELTANQRARISALTDEAAQATSLAEERGKIAADHERVLSRLKDQYEHRIRLLEADLSDARESGRENREKFLASLKHNDGLHEKAQSYTRLEARCEELAQDRAAAITASEKAVAAANVAQEGLASVKAQLASAREQLELLKVDKAYLRRERDDKKAGAMRLEAALERERERGDVLEQRVETVRGQLLDARESARSEFEQRLAHEVENMRSANSKQLAALKEAQLSQAERELRASANARDEARAEAEALQSKLSDAQGSLEEARVDLAAERASAQTALAQVRSQLNVRVFETETLANTIEERGATVRKLELQNEMLESKLHVLKADFVALEAANSKQLIELTAKVSTQEEKIGVYEALELEIDAALLDQAKHQVYAKADANKGNKQEQETRGPIGASSDEEDGDQTDTVVQGLITIAARNDAARRHEQEEQPHQSGADRPNNQMGILPVSAQRRVKHSVLLAQKLVQTERLLEAAKAEAREKSSALGLLRKRLRAAEEAAAITAQPQAFLVERLSKREEECDSAKARAAVFEADKRVLEGQMAKLKMERDQIHADLTKVLEERGALEKAVKEQVSVARANAQTSPMSRSYRAGVSPRSAASRSPVSGARSPTQQPRTNLQDQVVYEVDVPDVSNLDASTLSVASAESSTFVLHRQDEAGIPLPKWYRKLRQSEL